MRGWRRWGCISGLVSLTLLWVMPAGAASTFASGAFQTQWQAGEAITPNFWGPLQNATGGLQEPYTEASLGFSESGPPNPGQGLRLVQYFDKGRMEITAPASGNVTNGLLATEIVTGQIQVGNRNFQAKAPPAIPIAGDPDNTGPTYADLSGKAAALLAPTTPRIGNFITMFIAADGTLSDGGGFAGISMSPKIGVFDDPTKHNVLDQFVTYRNKVGLATIGYARSEPFRAMVKVAGQPQSVIAQVFERRVLTYTASNPDPYKVEFGNIGQHYYQWRYRGITPMPVGMATGTAGTTMAGGGTVGTGDAATAVAQLLPTGFELKSLQTVDLGDDGGQQATALVESAGDGMGRGAAQIAALLVRKGGQWTLAFRTKPDSDTVADITAYPKSARHPGFVTASYHNCGANCNSGEHYVLRYDGNGSVTQIVNGGDDRGAIQGNLASGQITITAPIHRTQDGRCCASYRYTRTFDWQNTTLIPGPFVFSAVPEGKFPLPGWLRTDGPSLLPFFSPFQTDPLNGNAIGNAMLDPLPVTDLQGKVCLAPGKAAGQALARIILPYVAGLWKDGDRYKAAVNLGSLPNGGGTPTAKAGNCTLGESGGGYVLTVRVGPENVSIVALQAVPDLSQVIPDDAIEVPPV